MNGNPHPLTEDHVSFMLLMSWYAFLGGGAMNFLFYQFHPSFFDLTYEGKEEKRFIYIFGRKKFLSLKALRFWKKATKVTTKANNYERLCPSINKIRMPRVCLLLTAQE